MIEAREYSSHEVASLAGVKYATLDYWTRSGVLAPSIEAADGSGSQRRYSVADVRTLSVIVELRRFGIELQAINVEAVRRAIELLSPDNAWLACVDGEWFACRREDLQPLPDAGASLMLFNLSWFGRHRKES